MTGNLRTVVVVAMVALLMGLGTSATVSADGEVFTYPRWRERVLAAGLDPDAVIYPFDTTPEMIAWAEAVAADATGSDPLSRLQRLQDAMFDDDRLGFDYEETSTLTAKEAFEAGTGNCLSFTSLFVALSRAIGIQTFLVSPRRDPEFGRDQDLVVVNRHVVAGYRHGRHLTLFDFYLASSAPSTGSRVVDDIRASAMVHTNLGGTALREGRPEEALRQLQIATSLSPDWAAGWVNMGVARARLGDVDGAFAAHRKALEVEAGNSSALTNMSILYRELGRESEARIALLAAARHTDNPYTLVAVADAAMLLADYRRASSALKRARRWYPNEPVVYDGLARLALRTGDQDRADRLLRKAARLRAERRADPD